MIGGKPADEIFAGVGEDNAPRAVHNRANPLGAKGGSNVGRAGSLGAIAGDQQGNVRHGLPEFGQLARVGRPDHGTSRPQPAGAQVGESQLLDESGDLLEQFAAGRVGEILKSPRAGVAGPDQDVDSAAPGPRRLEERHQGIAAHVGIDRQGIDPPLPRTGSRVPKVGLGVGLGGGPDVAPLGVRDDEQPRLAGSPHDPPQHRHSRRPALFEERHLGLDDGNHPGDRIDDPQAEFLVAASPLFRRAARPCLGPLTNGGWQTLPAGIEPDTHGVARLADGVGETIGEVGSAHGPVGKTRGNGPVPS